MNWDEFVTTWRHLFTLWGGQVTWSQVFMYLILPLVILMAFWAIELLVIKYVQSIKYTKALVTAQQHLDELDDKDGKVFESLTADYKFAHEKLHQSMFNDNVPILKVFGWAFWWWVTRSLFTFVACVVIIGGINVLEMAYALIAKVFATTFAAVPNYMGLTIIIGLIPIAIAIKRNKPQWLKLVLTVSEILVALALLIEWGISL